ncbi:hypothetical protein PIB30_031366 [Stylosanthes scabra]|uniref:Uncharacterized protein n=1 Tax=Stylosanthes scabra TaxID=79078 RepID=A0ABU6WA62_9FABA|nr:hypothetical protein [Stylosanthes scabra]
MLLEEEELDRPQLITHPRSEYLPKPDPEKKPILETSLCERTRGSLSSSSSKQQQSDRTSVATALLMFATLCLLIKPNSPGVETCLIDKGQQKRTFFLGGQPGTGKSYLDIWLRLLQMKMTSQYLVFLHQTLY